MHVCGMSEVGRVLREKKGLIIMIEWHWNKWNKNYLIFVDIMVYFIL